MARGRLTANQSGNFGGAWTDVKLDKLSSYLAAYVKVMKNTAFTTMYVDAFAGSGFLKPIQIASGLFAEEQETIPAGSARLALDVSPPFSSYVFIEKSKTRHKQLVSLTSTHPDLNILFKQGDANIVLAELCREADWTRTRGVVFLDPFGMQVEWSTIQALGQTRAVDLWYLVPTGIAYLRMMPKGKPPPPDWQARLDRAFGDQGWRQLYEQGVVRDLFEGEKATVTRAGGVKLVEAYVMSRLRSAFHGVSPHVGRLNNSRNQLYSLVFCCGNPMPSAQRAAMRIANHILAQR